MTYEELLERCLTYPDAFEDHPFGSEAPEDGGWTVIRHRLNRKGFAFIFMRGGLCINLKCEPLRADLLRQLYRGVTPAYHMNKLHWNSVKPDSDVPEDVLYDMIEHSYRLTMPKACKGSPSHA